MKGESPPTTAPPLPSAAPALSGPPLKEAFRIGLSHRLTRIRDEDGQWVEDPTAVDATLWRSRKDIWPSLASPGLGKPSWTHTWKAERLPFRLFPTPVWAASPGPSYRPRVPPPDAITCPMKSITSGRTSPRTSSGRPFTPPPKEAGTWRASSDL
eukprot:1568707-Heterocapsa_arctica.AAC.1